MNKSIETNRAKYDQGYMEIQFCWRF